MKVGKLEAAEATLEAAEATLEAVEATLEATDLDEVVAILKAADVLALQDGILAVLDDIPESMRCMMHRKPANEFVTTRKTIIHKYY